MGVRDKLLEAAAGVFAESGSRGATTRRIAQAAGVNEVTLFRHFGSKEQLLHEALRQAAQRALDDRLPDPPGDPEAEIGTWARAHLRHLHGARAMIRTAMGEFEENPVASRSACAPPVRFTEELVAYVRALQAQGRADADCDPYAAANLLMGAIFADATSRDIMPARFPQSPDEAATAYARLFLRAIGVTRTRDRSCES